MSKENTALVTTELSKEGKTAISTITKALNRMVVDNVTIAKCVYAGFTSDGKAFRQTLIKATGFTTSTITKYKIAGEYLSKHDEIDTSKVNMTNLYLASNAESQGIEVATEDVYGNSRDLRKKIEDKKDVENGVVREKRTISRNAMWNELSTWKIGRVLTQADVNLIRTYFES